MRTFILNKMRGLKTRVIDAFQPDSPTLRCIPYKGLTFVAPIHHDVGWRLLKDRGYEAMELELLEQLARPDDMVIDIGANIGIYSLVLARIVREGKVIAVEPGPLNLRCLCASIALNEIDNVRVERRVVSDHTGNVEFALSEDETYSSLVETGRRPTSRTMIVEALTLDVLAGADGADVVKIDVEGAELKVLRGGTELLSRADRRPRVLLIELNAENQKVYGDVPNDVVQFLKRFGYEVFTVTPDGLKKGYMADLGCEDFLFLDEATLGDLPESFQSLQEIRS